MDGALSLVRRNVGTLNEELKPGLYKVKVNRGGALREQIVTLGPDTKPIYLFVDEFPAIAPIGPLLDADRTFIEHIAQQALGPHASDRTVLLLSHWRIGDTLDPAPFHRTRLFPWGKSREAIELGRLQVFSWTGVARIWAAVAATVEAGPGTYVLELRNGPGVSRQAVLVSKDWQTRIFVRRQATPAHASGQATLSSEPSADVSIQMSFPRSGVVYDDHWQTIEVARNALEKGREIFVNLDRWSNTYCGESTTIRLRE